MKKVLTAILALTIISVCASAQTTPSTIKAGNRSEVRKHPGKHHRHRKIRRMHRHHRMAQQLNFSEAQKQQATVYREDFKKKMKALNSNENITVKEQRDQRTALLKDQKAKMQSLLTPEQKNKMAQLKTEHKAKAEQHYTAHLDKMKAQLSLTDKQVASMKTQHEAMMVKVKAIKENESLDRTAKKEKLMALKTEMKAAHQKIFTPDQLQKMEEMKKARMEKKAVK
ncbi:hypothetical protein [Ferruginibacter sp. SUN106]|uniref:hypothetical protein n=1 Tax=Ferruginibacter sp. SUN106 TaxID=2978348 RepID=UPI003D36E780